MKITAKQLKRIILEERRRLKYQMSIEDKVRREIRMIMSEQKGKLKGKVVAGARKVFGVNMKKLKAADEDTYDELVKLMDEDADYDGDQKWGPVFLYTQAATNVRGRPDPNLVAQLPVKPGSVEAGMMTDDDRKAAQELLKDREGIVTTDDPEEEWEYKVTDDAWYTRKKDKSTGWIKLEGKKFCKAVNKLDGLFPDMRSNGAKAATKKECAKKKPTAHGAVKKPEQGPPSPHAIGDEVELDGIMWKKIEVGTWQTSLTSAGGTNPYLWVTSPDYKRGQGEGTLIAVESVQVHRKNWGYKKTGDERQWRDYKKVKLSGGRGEEGPKISKGEGMPSGRGVGPLEGEHENMPTWNDLEGARVISESVSHRWLELAGILKG